MKKKAGTMIDAIQNAFVRTRSRYSRRMTAKILVQLISSSLDGPGFFDAGLSNRVQVDLFELRVLRREALERVAIDRSAEELALIGPRKERNDVAAVHRLAGGDSGQSCDLSGRRFHGQVEKIARKSPLQLAQVSFQNLLRPGEQADLVAELFRLLEDVGREDDRLPPPSEVAQVLLDDRGVDRIEARKRRVQD